jgi:hypothetical protein
MKTLPFLTLALLLATPRLHADATPAPQERRAAELVHQLGDDSFDVRERATKELLRLGLAARRALQEGAGAPDLEVRRRCKELLPAVLEADRRARLDAFLADTEGKHKHDLPAWERFRKLVGQDRADRDFFAAMLRHDAGFLADVERHPDRAGELCAEQCRLMFQRLYGGTPGPRVPPEVAEVAPVLLVAADPATRFPPEVRPLVANFFYQETVRSALRSPSPFRKLVVAWMARQTDDEDAAQQMFFVASQTLDLREGLDLALRVLRERPVKARGLAGALVTVGKLGNPHEHRAILERFLKDTTVVGSFAVGRDRGTTQVRDVALAMLVHLTDQDPKSYGFAFVNRHAYLRFHASFLGFAGDVERDRALARWRDWSARTRK